MKTQKFPSCYEVYLTYVIKKTGNLKYLYEGHLYGDKRKEGKLLQNNVLFNFGREKYEK